MTSKSILNLCQSKSNPDCQILIIGVMNNIFHVDTAHDRDRSSATVTTHLVPGRCRGRGDGHLQEVDSEIDDSIGHIGLMDRLQHTVKWNINISRYWNNRTH